jgi:hypothetical protein
MNPHDEIDRTTIIGPPMLRCTCGNLERHQLRCPLFQLRTEAATVDGASAEKLPKSSRPGQDIVRRLMDRLMEPGARNIVLHPAELARWIDADPGIIPFVNPASLAAAERFRRG